MCVHLIKRYILGGPFGNVPESTGCPQVAGKRRGRQLRENGSATPPRPMSDWACMTPRRHARAALQLQDVRLSRASAASGAGPWSCAAFPAVPVVTAGRDGQTLHTGNSGPSGTTTSCGVCSSGGWLVLFCCGSGCSMAAGGEGGTAGVAAGPEAPSNESGVPAGFAGDCV